MRRFGGFSERVAYVPVPVPLLSSIAPDIEALSELKVTLHLILLLHQQKRFPRYVLQSQLAGDPFVVESLRAANHTEPLRALEEGLGLAVARGTFLAANLQENGHEDRAILLNTFRNQQVVRRIVRGELTLEEGKALPVLRGAGAESRPDIYELYEQNVALLTPLIAEELQEAERRFPASWIEDAFREAVAYNRRNWRYIHRILERWASEGRVEVGEAGRHPQGAATRQKHLTGKYSGPLRR